MSVIKRLKKLESNELFKQPCFCGKTFVDVLYGETPLEDFTYCPKCKKLHDYWNELAREASEMRNLTDEK
jgi:hypothetical protein